MKMRRYLPTGRVGHLQIAGVPERHEPDLGELNYPYLFALLDELGYAGTSAANTVRARERPRGWAGSRRIGRRSEIANFYYTNALSSDWYWEQDGEFRFTSPQRHAGSARGRPRQDTLGAAGLRRQRSQWAAHARCGASAVPRLRLPAPRRDGAHPPRLRQRPSGVRRARPFSGLPRHRQGHHRVQARESSCCGWSMRSPAAWPRRTTRGRAARGDAGRLRDRGLGARRVLARRRGRPA